MILNNTNSNADNHAYSNGTFIYRFNKSSLASSRSAPSNNDNANSSKFYLKYSRRENYLRWNTDDLFTTFRAGSADVDVSGLSGSIASILLELDVKYHNANVEEHFITAGKKGDIDDRVILQSSDNSGTATATAGTTKGASTTAFSVVQANVAGFFDISNKVNTIADADVVKKTPSAVEKNNKPAAAH